MRKDIGETKNLAEKNPKIVASLNKLIVKHLKDTNAIVPAANPKYNPNAGPVFGWQALNNCGLKATNGKLEVKILGDDPFFQTAKVPDAVGPVKICFRMKADVAGNGRVYWSTDKLKSFTGNFKAFTIKKDKKWNEYSVELSNIPKDNHLRQLRIDPGDNIGKSSGKVEFDWICIKSSKGVLLKEWNFIAEPK